MPCKAFLKDAKLCNFFVIYLRLPIVFTSKLHFDNPPAGIVVHTLTIFDNLQILSTIPNTIMTTCNGFSLQRNMSSSGTGEGEGNLIGFPRILATCFRRASQYAQMFLEVAVISLRNGDCSGFSKVLVPFSRAYSKFSVSRSTWY